jgi:5'-methylthioadenosine phosphorylase
MDELFSVQKERQVKTDHGSVAVYECRTGGADFLFLPRHGRKHEVAPHRVDYLANLRALMELGVKSVIATGAVGSISKKLGVGEMGLLEQFIDMSKRHTTAFEEGAVHVDMTNPYDRVLRGRLISAARSLRIPLRTDLCYLSVDGPRYETAAEIRAFAMLGGDVVGMTGAPEAIISNELGIRYASIVVATNWGAGIQEKVSHEEVVSTMTSAAPRIKRLIERAISEP